ncbi:C6 zinc finger domain containing protein [Colletotrichum higginsianum]|nr:C6 zinc finger domain containing protein [Colletotrichum higginsianum]
MRADDRHRHHPLFHALPSDRAEFNGTAEEAQVFRQNQNRPQPPVEIGCSRKGIKCGGFAQGLRWSFKHQPVLQDLTFEDFNAAQGSSKRPAAEHVPEGRSPAERRSSGSSDTSSARDRYSISSSSSSSRTSAREEAERQGNGNDTTVDRRSDDGLEEMSRITVEEPPISPRRTPANTLVRPPDPSSSSTTNDQRQRQQRQRQRQQQHQHHHQNQNQNQNQLAPYSLTPGLADTSSAFVINWFEQVCPAWSGFDSNTNLNRKIAIDLWRTSATVCSSLESMSAAFLASRLPSMRQSALRLMQRATDFIQAELQVVKARPDHRAVPTGLLFSLFCLGTTVCWIDSRLYGLPFLREARSLIRRLNAQSAAAAAFSTANQDMLSFFNKSLAYCEMLLSVVRDDEPLDQQADDHPESQLQVTDERSPHPWTGVSTLTTRLFAQCIRLCRTARHRLRQAAMDPQKYFSNALQDLIGAQRLEEQLLELDFPSESPEVDTGDSSTPVSHLARVAEAYRLSSLLHLYQTFPDLVSLRLPAESPMTESGSVPWDEWIIPLALRLVKVLEHIPATSGTRVIQPLLYISASTGLRHDAPAASDMFAAFGSLQQDLMGGTGSNMVSPPPLFDSHNLSLYISQMADAPAREGPMSNMTLDVGSARHFVMRRLSILESSLPPTPVVVAKELVQSIWRAYDGDIGSPTVHWIDVMEDNDLRSMFG